MIFSFIKITILNLSYRHPLSQENQKKVLEAEQEYIKKRKREEEAALEIAKEREMQQYEMHGDITERDPRNSSLKFMYVLPKKISEDDDETVKKNIDVEGISREELSTPYLGIYTFPLFNFFSTHNNVLS